MPDLISRFLTLTSVTLKVNSNVGQQTFWLAHRDLLLSWEDSSLRCLISYRSSCGLIYTYYLVSVVTHSISCKIMGRNLFSHASNDWSLVFSVKQHLKSQTGVENMLWTMRPKVADNHIESNEWKTCNSASTGCSSWMDAKRIRNAKKFSVQVRIPVCPDKGIVECHVWWSFHSSTFILITFEGIISWSFKPIVGSSSGPWVNRPSVGWQVRKNHQTKNSGRYPGLKL